MYGVDKAFMVSWEYLSADDGSWVPAYYNTDSLQEVIDKLKILQDEYNKGNICNLKTC